MYLEHFHLTHSPFQEEPDSEIFFPGGKRDEICQELVLDILAGKPLIKLVAREGMGKTLLCRLIAERLPDTHDVVYIDNPIGAFDDLLRVTCFDLGMDPTGIHESTSYREELNKLLEDRCQQRIKTVLIVDEAEKLFLATLERLLRNICEFRQDLGFTVVLSGRPGLDANLEQLSAFCADVNIQDGYTLDALSESETRQYLRFRLNAAGLSREQQGDIFTGGAVSKIFTSSQGNPRMINILAEESLQISYSEKSFMVLLDHVDSGEHERYPRESRVVEMYDLLHGNKMLISLFLGLIFVALGVGVWLLQKGEQPNQVPPPPVVSDTSSVEEQVSGEQKFAPAGAPEEQGLVEQASSSEKRAIKVSKEVAVESHAPAQSPANDAGRELESEEDHAALNDEATTPPEPLESFVETTQARIKRQESRDGERLFRERRGASASWLAGAYRGGYTIQLMMLMSDQAQAGITRMLVTDDYYNIRDKLYILHKKTSPPTLFVFYGIFDSMEAAREARNNMPLFLRKHHPYPLSINDALKKTEK